MVIETETPKMLHNFLKIQVKLIKTFEKKLWWLIHVSDLTR